MEALCSEKSLDGLGPLRNVASVEFGKWAAWGLFGKFTSGRGMCEGHRDAVLG